MKYFTASCFQDLTGRYLSLRENNASLIAIKACSEEDAYEKIGERQLEDSELTIEERWLVLSSTEEVYNAWTGRKL